MTLLTPLGGAGLGGSNLSGRPTTTQGIVLTASATPHALPAAPTEILSATSFEANWIEIIVKNTRTAATVTDSLLNLYIGAASSEVLLIDSLSSGWAHNHDFARGMYYWFPLRIPAGTRLSGSLRALIASDICNLEVNYGWNPNLAWSGVGVETLGEDTANSRGTSVTAGDASEGAFTSIGTNSRRYGYITLGVQGNNDTSMASGTCSWDVGTGSAVLQGMTRFEQVQSSDEYHSNIHHGWWCDVAASTALQVRGQFSATPSGQNYITLHGVY